MELRIVAAVLALAPIYILAIEENNVVKTDPMLPSLNIQRDTASHDMLQLIYKMLLEHTETLEKIMAVVQNNEHQTKKIIEHLDDGLEQPQTHGKIKIYRSNRRSNNENEDIPIVQFGKDIVKYGNLLKSVVMSDITKISEPVTVVDTNVSPYHIDVEALRNSESNHEKTRKYSNTKNLNNEETARISDSKKANSLWCDVASKCNTNFHSVCGFDDNFGLAIFNGICHMLEINCYLNFNFSVAPC